MKKTISAVIILFALSGHIYAAPVAAVSGINGSSERSVLIAGLLEHHLLEITKKYGFSIIQPEVINRELKKFNCLEEKCILGFASDAGIDLLFTGGIADTKDNLSIKLSAYGTGFPFNGRVIYSRRINLPLDIPINTREFSLICEEQAAGFIASVLKTFQHRVKVKSSGGKFILDSETVVSGKFRVYSTQKSGAVKDSGDVEIEANVLGSYAEQFPGSGFILVPYREKSAEIEKYYHQRKREIVFGKNSLYDTLFLFSAIPFASSTMPLSSPVLGYYMNDDWSGLGLWMINISPYLYIEAAGFLNSPKRLKEQKKDISRNESTMNMFAWYMLAAGGMPLFIDSYSHNYLHHASYFSEKNLMLGNTATAAMLSLTSNGAGHFYRGDRFWGYFYFHLNNSLLFMTLREFTADQRYNETTGSYTKGKTDKSRRNLFVSLFALSKALETIHATLSDDKISSGEITDEYILPSPFFTLDTEGNPVLGASMTLKF